MKPFSPDRFNIAQKRRRLKGTELANLSGVTEITISRISKGKNEPDTSTVEALAKALNYPVAFFYAGEIEILNKDEVSFRSLSRMAALDRDAAIAAGSIGMLLAAWIDERFNLPSADVPDFRESAPEQAAALLRQHWGIGERPISNLLKLLESKGIRIFSLCENTKNVDAFSFWRNDQPFVFLNTFKTAERSCLDAAHEVGHLVLHRHSSMGACKQAETEANQFASAFLMPKADMLAKAPRRPTVDNILKAKKRWRVSAMAMTTRLYSLNRLTEWQYRSACIELSKRGYRTSEPIGIDRESSTVLQMIFQELWKDKITKKEVAADLNIAMDELESLVFGLIGASIDKPSSTAKSQLRSI